MYAESEKPRKFFSNIWVQVAIAFFIVEAIIFSVITYLFRVLRVLSYSEWDFYLTVFSTLGTIVVFALVPFLKERRERHSAKKQQ